MESNRLRGEPSRRISEFRAPSSVAERPGMEVPPFGQEAIREFIKAIFSRAVSGTIAQFSSAYAEALESVLPLGVFWHRYVTNCPTEKALIGRYVSRTFVKDGLRAFVQASTSTVYLGRQLASNASRGTLFYTNSVVFPLTTLRENSFHQVYTFCGPIFDQVCAGWLFPLDDTATAEELRRLFRRQKDPLTTAILAPSAVKVESGPYFARAETALLATIVSEVAEHVIVLAPGERIYWEEEALPPSAPWNRGWCGDWPHPRNRVSLVAVGAPASGDVADMSRAFEAQGIDVHWQDPASGLWPDEFGRSPEEMTALCERDELVIQQQSAEHVWRLAIEAPSESGAAAATERADGPAPRAECLGHLWRLAVDSPREFLRLAFRMCAETLEESNGVSDHRRNKAQDLLYSIFEIKHLLEAFQKRHKVSGTGGVAELLDLSRNAVYVAMDRLDLDADDFRHPEATVSRLVMKSDHLRSTVVDMYCRLQGAVQSAKI